MNIKNKKLIAVIFLLVFFVLPKQITIANQNEKVNKIYSINLSKSAIEKGYTVDGFNGDLKLSLVPGILKEATGVEVIQLQEKMLAPAKIEMISGIYQFEFKNKTAYDSKKPFYIQFSYSKLNNFYKQVYFYDKNYNTWRPLPTRDFPDQLFVRSLIHLPYARIAVFADSSTLTVGSASWFSHYQGNYAASPDFPIGSKLRVYNLETEKNKKKAEFVDVIIKDFGPDRTKHPDRVVDLDKTAFSRLSDTSEGLIRIHIEPLYVAPKNGKVLAATTDNTDDLPQINSKSAYVIDENTNEVFVQKDADKVMPLASLTKMLAVKVFLSSGVQLDKVVTYSKKDIEYNSKYCDISVSARLKVSDGDTMTVRDLIYASLVGSANNSIESLTRVSGWSREEFIRKMNETALKIGATNSHFVEPTGLSPENISTAKDYALISKSALSEPVIAKACTTKEYNFDTINTKIHHSIKNTSKILRNGEYNVTGSKTGYLEEAGYCLMTRVKSKNGDNVIIVIFGAESLSKRDSETIRLIDYALRRLDGTE
jgi:serine-type D-Ala-D-Ala endopeptidase (penicillin-binding protein 7)